MTLRAVEVNRAPVLTLWAAVVAERLGQQRATALTLGKAIAGLNAQSKGRRLGIYAAKEATAEERKAAAAARAQLDSVPLLGREVPVIETAGGVRATEKGRPIDSASVERYLEQKLGDALEEVRSAFEALARSRRPAELAATAFELYERFRPAIPAGKRGWGAKGQLDLDRVRALARERSES